MSDERWEAYLLEDPDAAQWADDWRRDEQRRQDARRIGRSLSCATCGGMALVDGRGCEDCLGTGTITFEDAEQ